MFIDIWRIPWSHRIADHLRNWIAAQDRDERAKEVLIGPCSTHDVKEGVCAPSVAADVMSPVSFYGFGETLSISVALSGLCSAREMQELPNI